MTVREKVNKQISEFWRAVRSDFRSLFLTGLLVIFPVWVTYLTIRFLIGLMDKAILILPSPWRPENVLGFHIPGVGIIITVLIILVVGFVARNIVGRKLVSWGESLIDTIPLVRSVYSAIKKFTYMILGGSHDFQRAVAVEYPRKGVWTIGFVTNLIPKESMPQSVPDGLLSVFLPTTPNPTSGWFLMIPESDCVSLNMSIEDAIKVIVSGGVVMPGSAEMQRYRDEKKREMVRPLDEAVLDIKIE